MQQLFLTAAFAAWVLCPAGAAPPPPPPPPVTPRAEPQVNTTSGIILGHQAPNRTGVSEFLGIQYGQAPVGELRFAAPKRYIAPAGTVFEASEWVRVYLSCTQDASLTGPVTVR
jgi:hypothetical protein